MSSSEKPPLSLRDQQESLSISESSTAKRFIRLPEVVRLTGLSRSTVYKLCNADEFPERRYPGGRVTVWIEAEVVAWMEAQSKIVRPRQ